MIEMIEMTETIATIATTEMIATTGVEMTEKTDLVSNLFFNKTV
jgi:hypothetical protein